MFPGSDALDEAGAEGQSASLVACPDAVTTERRAPYLPCLCTSLAPPDEIPPFSPRGVLTSRAGVIRQVASWAARVPGVAGGRELASLISSRALGTPAHCRQGPGSAASRGPVQPVAQRSSARGRGAVLRGGWRRCSPGARPVRDRQDHDAGRSGAPEGAPWPARARLCAVQRGS